MIKDIIVSLLELHESAWSESLGRFIKSSGTVLLSDKPGTYTVSSLISELRIRSNSVHDAGIECIGMVELLKSLHELDGNAVVQNYVFKNLAETGIVYMSGDARAIIGAMLIVLSSTEN